MVGRPPPAWAPRRDRRGPDIRSGLVRAVLVPIRARSYAVPTGLLDGVVPSQHRQVSIEDAGAGGGWRVWAGRLSGWVISNLCQPHRKAILAFSGGFGNLPRQDCHLFGRARSWGPWRGGRGILTSILAQLRPSLYQSGRGRASFRPPFRRGWYPANAAEERLERASTGARRRAPHTRAPR